jgi:arginase family enzyme
MASVAYNLLHLDDALLAQPDFLARVRGLPVREHDERPLGGQIRLWSDAETISLLSERLEAKLLGLDRGGTTVVTWLGSGDFHHVTAVLVRILAKVRQERMTVVHFDHHPDWVVMRSGAHCGSWVSDLLARGIVDRVVSIGPSSRDLAWPELKRADLDLLANGKLAIYPFNPPRTYVWRRYANGPGHAQSGHRLRWTCFDPMPTEAAIEEIMRAIPSDTIYVTIDKDVLRRADAVTNWDQGICALDDLLAWLRPLLGRRRVAGVDVSGDHSPARYDGSSWTRLKKRAEAFMDQPVRKVDRAASAAVNQRTNLALLETLQTALCR